MKYIFTQSTVRVAIMVLLLTTFLFASVVYAQESLKNPLNSNFSSIPAFIAGALKALALIALPIITLFFVISGFMFVMARGNQEQLKKAKMNFLYVVIGTILILGAWILATLIAGTVSEIATTGETPGFFGEGSSPY